MVGTSIAQLSGIIYPHKSVAGTGGRFVISRRSWRKEVPILLHGNGKEPRNIK